MEAEKLRKIKNCLKEKQKRRFEQKEQKIERIKKQ